MDTDMSRWIHSTLENPHIPALMSLAGLSLAGSLRSQSDRSAPDGPTCRRPYGTAGPLRKEPRGVMLVPLAIPTLFASTSLSLDTFWGSLLSYDLPGPSPRLYGVYRTSPAERRIRSVALGASLRSGVWEVRLPAISMMPRGCNLSAPRKGKPVRARVACGGS